MVVHQPVAIVELYAGSRGIPGSLSSFVVKKEIASSFLVAITNEANAMKSSENK